MAKKKQGIETGKVLPRPTENRAGSDDPWLKDPTLIRRFQELQPRHKALCEEVAYTLETVLRSGGIKVAALLHRPKTLDSFLEKIQRKKYGDPFKEITDFAGVRVVCYYTDDVDRVGDVIRRHFQVCETEDKSKAAGTDRFGYVGTHYLLRLGANSTGARYDDLKKLICEIQVRTVMQDAWAILSHYLMYKREADVPDPLKRRINALAGALDSADFAFQAIRDKRDEYKSLVASSAGAKDLASVVINADSLEEYLKGPDAGLRDLTELERTEMEDLLERLPAMGYTKLSQIDELLEQTRAARNWFWEHHPEGEVPPDITLTDDVSVATMLVNKSFRKDVLPSFREVYEEAEKLIKPPVEQTRAGA